MRKIGLLSDTHGFIDQKVFSFFAECDEIWHAGDFGNIESADKLAEFKPLRGVYGNIDDHQVRLSYPKHHKFRCEEVKVWMTHIGGYPGHYDKSVRPGLNDEAPQLFICGHSHILRVMYDKKYNLLYMNPGAAGNHGFHKVKTLLRFEIDKDQIKNLEIMEIPRKTIESTQDEGVMA
jgi:uncharacterized protein